MKKWVGAALGAAVMACAWAGGAEASYLKITYTGIVTNVYRDNGQGQPISVGDNVVQTAYFKLGLGVRTTASEYDILRSIDDYDAEKVLSTPLVYVDTIFGERSVSVGTARLLQVSSSILYTTLPPYTFFNPTPDRYQEVIIEGGDRYDDGDDNNNVSLTTYIGSTALPYRPFQSSAFTSVNEVYPEADFSVNGTELNFRTTAYSQTIVNTVPLPASAPLFGAALLALAGLSYAWRRQSVTAR